MNEYENKPLSGPPIMYFVIAGIIIVWSFSYLAFGATITNEYCASIGREKVDTYLKEESKGDLTTVTFKAECVTKQKVYKEFYQDGPNCIGECKND